MSKASEKGEAMWNTDNPRRETTIDNWLHRLGQHHIWLQLVEVAAKGEQAAEISKRIEAGTGHGNLNETDSNTLQRGEHIMVMLGCEGNDLMPFIDHRLDQLEPKVGE